MRHEDIFVPDQYSLAALSLRASDDYDDFRRRVLSLTAMPAAPTNP
jgi:hypothetical protein